MEKRPLWAWPYRSCPVLSLCSRFTLFLTLKDPSARRRQVTERSERTVEEAEKNQRLLGALTL